MQIKQHDIFNYKVKVHNIKSDAELNCCKLIIAGTRTFISLRFLDIINKEIKEQNIKPAIIIAGGAGGIDSLAERYAKDNNIDTHVFNAQWNRFGKVAGHMRNNIMAEQGDVLLLVWDGKSPGSKQMRSAALQRKLMVVEVIV